MKNWVERVGNEDKNREIKKESDDSSNVRNEVDGGIMFTSTAFCQTWRSQKSVAGIISWQPMGKPTIFLRLKTFRGRQVPRNIFHVAMMW